ncbi:dihydroorotate dehydrogenase electron transfer subunit [Fodinisporobacter ferrooxydans]|uniref:Dihydroorotate dehydrogenase B (NAD(+)), electron transfer subunit n=1 Tax=Fodinisporobacter ferrooxydans TaxID=2901836 RepID=A0ABY4CF79_9BACL|nr:dihydroorotate dehydrogenase electron transfer subunit [Alicyclobacillaceae bacterium MYW30-H2]
MKRWTILAHQPVARQMMQLDLQVDDAFAYVPGQFLHVRVTDGHDFLLRRPISLCNFDPDTRVLSLVYRVGGDGTRALAKRTPGMEVDVLGPLGQGFPIHEEDGHALLIGGGIGVPPLVELAKQITAQGKTVTAVIGFLTKDVVILEKELQMYGDVFVCTDDGSYGHHGRVTDLLTADLLASVDRYYSCGPLPMLQAIVGKIEAKVPGYVSLEERMGCGIGACMACVQWTVDEQGNKRLQKICKQGPVFDGREVVFE